MIWTDAHGLRWEVIDWHRPDPTGKRKGLELGAWNAEGRAFVPVDRDGPVMIYNYNRTPYTSDRNLREQLKFAKPSSATAAERLAGGTPRTDADASASSSDNTNSSKS